MRLHLAFITGFACLSFVQAPVALAQTTAQAPAGDIAQALQIDDVLAVMQAEGVAAGNDLAENMFGGTVGPEWQAKVALVYDITTMRQNFDRGLAQAVGDDAETLAKALAFLDSDLGRRVVGLEIEARRALLDPAVEEAAKADWAALADSDAARVAQLEQFAQVNDLIESNVMGALNANLAYYRAMSEAGAFGDKMPEDQMLAEVWAQEADLRTETVDWLFPYLALAYSPLGKPDLQAYLDFSATPEGRRLNAVIFAAFDAVFVAVSTDLGRAVALQMIGQDI